MTARHHAKETPITTQDLHEETPLTVSHEQTEAALAVHPGPDETAARATVQEAEPSTTEAAALPPRGGDPRALLVARLLAAAALLVTAFIHVRLAADTGLGGPMLGRGHLFAAQAVLSGILAVAMLTRDNWVWLVALVLSVAGLGAILASVYVPIPALGPLPAIDEPVWLLNKAICALAELSVISLWVVRQIAPPTREAAQSPELTPVPEKLGSPEAGVS